MENKEFNQESSSKKTHFVAKVISSVLVAMSISALSVTAAYALVTKFSPATDNDSPSAAYCSAADSVYIPQVSDATCGDDKDGDKKGDGDGSAGA